MIRNQKGMTDLSPGNMKVGHIELASIGVEIALLIDIAMQADACPHPRTIPVTNAVTKSPTDLKNPFRLIPSHLVSGMDITGKMAGQVLGGFEVEAQATVGVVDGGVVGRG